MSSMEIMLSVICFVFFGTTMMLKDLKTKLLKQEQYHIAIITKLTTIQSIVMKQKYIIQISEGYSNFDELIINKNELVTN